METGNDDGSLGLCDEEDRVRESMEQGAAHLASYSPVSLRRLLNRRESLRTARRNSLPRRSRRSSYQRKASPSSAFARGRTSSSGFTGSALRSLSAPHARALRDCDPPGTPPHGGPAPPPGIR